MNDLKICKICGENKSTEEQKFRSKLCEKCRNEKAKSYSKTYYQQHQKRLQEKNLLSYYENNPIRKKMGRPRIWNPEEKGGDEVIKKI